MANDDGSLQFEYQRILIVDGSVSKQLDIATYDDMGYMSDSQKHFFALREVNEWNRLAGLQLSSGIWHYVYVRLLP